MTENDSIYKRASQLNLLFPSDKGMLTVHDLWRLPITKVDELGIAIRNGLNSRQGESLRPNATPSPEMEIEQLKFDIIQDIINTRDTLQEQLKETRKIKEQEDLIESLIENQEQQALANLPKSELIERANQLKQQRIKLEKGLL